MEVHLVGFAFALILCACSCSALPASSRRSDITELVTLLGKLQTIERARQQQLHKKQQQEPAIPGIALSSRHKGPSSISAFSPSADHTFKALASQVRESSHMPRSFTPHEPSDPLLDLDLDLVNDAAAMSEGQRGGSRSASLESGSSQQGSGKIKRQGAWSYDYGLGGGRFGKRNYGDYGIGGGRFGRDVDHVDIMDTSDADAASL